MGHSVIASNHLPGQKANDDRLLTEERARLESCAFRLIARRRELNLELGRTFIRLKATLDHGRWKSYFAETFASSISLRTAQRYMDQARTGKSAAGSKNDKLSLFNPAGDAQATKTRQATLRARAEVGVSKDHVLRLSLSVTPSEAEAILALWNSPQRIEAEREIIAHLNRLCRQFESARRNENATPSA